MSLGSWARRKALNAGFGMIDKSLSSGEQGAEMASWWAKLKTFMNGKKTYTGIALALLPTLATTIAGVLVDNGIDPMLASKWTAWGGGSALAIVGAIHKLVKRLDDLTPDVPRS